LAGALVAEAALELFEFPSMELCPWALREGLILRRLDQLVFDGPLDPAPHIGLAQPPAALAQSSQATEAPAATAGEPARAAQR
jgi:exopolyphosphatase/guanosine-5'-triphosphate,3'-diphosphate pyrophosphatase